MGKGNIGGEMILAEYIWIDGTTPTARLRSKTKVLTLEDEGICPDWNFDGSSTNQADGDDSDVKLKVVRTVKDPFRKGTNYLVLCECTTHDGKPVESNARAKLRALLESGVRKKHEPWVGFEQEYTLIDEISGKPKGFPERGYPSPQGPYYCGTNIPGRVVMERHLQACIEAGLKITGTNAEVMVGQWEYQIGHGDPLEISDHLWIARYLLERIAEEEGVGVSLENKPVKGDWNGSGAHLNISIKSTREKNGLEAIDKVISKLKKCHREHILEYGHGLGERLTGEHETCHIGEFKWGVADRTASIRIPYKVYKDKRGYFEDRRPGANIDPYRACRRMLQTIASE